MGFETHITSFEMARPAVGGLQTLLPTVRLVGRRVMDDLKWAVVLPDKREMAEVADDEVPDNLAGVPRFRAYNKVRLPFLRYVADRRTVPPPPDFHRLASYLADPPASKSRRVREIPEKMSHIALMYDGTTNIDRATAHCSGFVINPAYTKDGYELALTVAEPERFYQEAELYNHAVKRIRAMKPFLKQFEAGSKDLAIPLAWIAEDMKPAEGDNILNDLEKYSVQQYTVQFGPLLPPYVQ